jgi:hypothetical protein
MFCMGSSASIRFQGFPPMSIMFLQKSLSLRHYSGISANLEIQYQVTR